jgi:hypothetical protein
MKLITKFEEIEDNTTYEFKLQLPNWDENYSINNTFEWVKCNIFKFPQTESFKKIIQNRIDNKEMRHIEK